jgi:hypothetical protein
MPEKSEQKYTKKIKARRGRPPGSKNKKIVTHKKSRVEKVNNKKTRSRVKISAVEEKPDKLAAFRSKRVKPLTIENLKSTQDKIQNCSHDAAETEELDNHIIIKAVKWLSQHMHHTEVQYYKSHSKKRNMSFINCMVSDILGFFNVKDTDLHKYVKTNKFIVNYTNTNGLHK